MRKIKNLISHPYSQSVFFVFSGSMVDNICAYFFHVIGGRYLGPSLYGSLASLVSLLYIVSILSGVFSTTALRELTKLWARKEKSKFYLLLKSFFSFFALCGIILFLIFFFASPFIADYLALNNISFVLLIGIIGFFSAINSVFSIFQRATLRFKQLSFFSAVTSVFRIILILLTWYFNFLIVGMLWAMIISGVLYFLLSAFDIYHFSKRKIVKLKKTIQPDFSLKNFLKKSSIILMVSLGMNGFLTSDIILVKHFFSPLESGFYAGVAVMGRVILYASGSLMTVMMPFIIRRREEKRNFKKIFFLNFGLVFLSSISLCFIYSFFPKIIILLFYGDKYLKALPFLPLFSVYMLFYTLAGIFVTYYVAMEEKRILLFPFFAATLQILLINLLHKTLFQVIEVSTFCAALLFAVFLIKFIIGERKNEKIQG